MSFFILMAKFHIYLSDLMYLIVASGVPSADDAQDLLSVDLIIEGLLGGFASYNGAVHALVRQSRLLQSLTLLQKVRALQMQNLCSARSRTKALDKARIAEKKAKKKKKWSSMEKGRYTPTARAIARVLQKSGTSQGKVGTVINYIAKQAGLEVKGKMSQRTVQRATIEGGVAACVQLGYDMADADSVTLSSDATSVRGENYEGAHVMINKGDSHKMRILSLTSTVSHSSETQLENLKKQISKIADIYHRSPLKQRSALNFEVHDFLRVWKGGNGDHAPDVKKFYRLGEEWKRESSRILLGYDELQRMEPQKLVDILKNNLEEVGGEADWAKLSDKEKNVFETLPEETKREIELFFWAGCSMHKELNCCKAFDDGMKKFYEEQPELDQPDDKKGLHDIYENYFHPTIGAGVRFPDVSNTRCQSHGRGRGRIITYLKEHHEFMEFVKDNKQKRTLNHLEQNIVKGLHCPQTISQIVALVLFCMAVMHPYTLHVRVPSTENLNMLDLGPYHSSVKDHMKKLIADATPLFSSSSNSYKDATLDGKAWSDTKAWAACIQLLPTLPHDRPLLLAGLKSALDCFERFTTEFIEGGLIDTSTEAERRKGNMPAHNCNNEGLLDGWGRFSRESPSSTVDHFTDQVDQAFLRQEARRIDESGLEKARREELNAHKLAAVEAKRVKDAEKAEKGECDATALAHHHFYACISVRILILPLTSFNDLAALRPVLFGFIDALSFVGFVLGAIIGKFTRYNISYILSVLIALGNLAFIYAFLPESLENQDRVRPLVPQRSVFKSIFSPISVFFRNTGSYKSLPLFGLAFYVFSLTSASLHNDCAMETTLLRWTHGSPFFPGLLGWLLLTAPRMLDLATLVCILPGIAWYWQRKHGTTSRAALHLAASLSHNALLLAAASCTGVLVFSIPHTSQTLYAIFAPLYTPAAAAAGPALYALGAGYFAALGRGGEMGSLFGALAIWGELGVCMTLTAYGRAVLDVPLIGDGEYNLINLLKRIVDHDPTGDRRVKEHEYRFTDAASDVIKAFLHGALLLRNFCIVGTLTGLIEAYHGVPMAPSIPVMTSQPVRHGEEGEARAAARRATAAEAKKSGVRVDQSQCKELGGIVYQACHSCLLKTDRANLKRCGRCHHVWYCSAICQKEDWPEHKKACGQKHFAPEAIAPAPAVRDEFIGCPSAFSGYIRTPALWRQIFYLSKPDSQHSDYHVGRLTFLVARRRAMASGSLPVIYKMQAILECEEDMRIRNFTHERFRGQFEKEYNVQLTEDARQAAREFAAPTAQELKEEEEFLRLRWASVANHPQRPPLPCTL
ncbi:hypothetical protein DFH08DRAFT_1013441 [Mycena albidolilacea]|uniref:MYND-type domain-containing protein n=1 Tax=Mycena albidolilacea TaxID=1033008 RepID=A0AAD7EP73_9AGAR|nr:hypothetical protein DFH08DRAFT_1013441 [Mycena albidolilacea]